MKFNLDNFTTDKVIVTTRYFPQCPKCGWENSLENQAHYCPKCGVDLFFSKITTRVEEVNKYEQS